MGQIEPIVMVGGIPNVFIGDPIVYEKANGEKSEAICMGVKWNEKKQTYLIKTDVTNAESKWKPLSVPMDKAWRIVGGGNPIDSQMDKLHQYLNPKKKKD